MLLDFDVINRAGDGWVSADGDPLILNGAAREIAEDAYFIETDLIKIGEVRGRHDGLPCIIEVYDNSESVCAGIVLPAEEWPVLLIRRTLDGSTEEARYRDGERTETGAIPASVAYIIGLTDNVYV